MNEDNFHSSVPLSQVEKGRSYFGALNLEVEHFAPLWHLIKIAQLLDTELNRISAHHGISIADFHLLSALMMENEMSLRAKDLAMKLNVSNAALSLRVRRLEGLGLVARRSNPADRRAAILNILPGGEELVHSVGTSLEQNARFIPWFKQLEQQERDLLARMLGSLHIFLHRDF